MIPLQSTVRIFGKTFTVVAIGSVGERYYWLLDDNGDVAMYPAAIIEYEEDKKQGSEGAV